MDGPVFPSVRDEAVAYSVSTAGGLLLHACKSRHVPCRSMNKQIVRYYDILAMDERRSPSSSVVTPSISLGVTIEEHVIFLKYVGWLSVFKLIFHLKIAVFKKSLSS